MVPVIGEGDPAPSTNMEAPYCLSNTVVIVLVMLNPIPFPDAPRRSTPIPKFPCWPSLTPTDIPVFTKASPATVILEPNFSVA